jgi:trypsin
MASRLRVLTSAALLAALIGSSPAQAGELRSGATVPTADGPVAVTDASATDGWRLDQQQTASPRVIGGTPAAIAATPWHVLLFSESGGRTSICGGSIINATTVLTASHCLDGIAIGSAPASGGLGVVAGISNFKTATPGDFRQERTVTAKRVHPRWGSGDKWPGGDVATVSFATGLDFTKPAVQPIALPGAVQPVDGEPIPVPATLSITGWGQETPTAEPNGTLNRQITNVLDPSACEGSVESAVNICGSSPSGTVCHGDSGSGLVTMTSPPVLEAVVSSGPEPCAAGSATWFASAVTPENRLFIVGNDSPPIAPRQTTGVRVSYLTRMQVGDAVTCSEGGFTNGASVKWKITNETGAQLATGVGPTFAYALAAGDVGHQVACRAYASNAGGVAVSERVAVPIAVVAAPVIATPPPKAPGEILVSGLKKVKRGHTVTIKVKLFGITPGATSATATVAKIPSAKTKKPPAPYKTTKKLKSTDAGATFTLKIKPSKKAKTGTRKLPVTVVVQRPGATAATYSRTFSLKVTR